MNSRFRDALFRLGTVVTILVGLICAESAGLSIAAELDRVFLRGGGEIACRVVSLDGRYLKIEEPGSRQRAISREEVEAIEFGAPDPPEISVRVMVLDADDQVRLYLDGEEIASPAALEAGWIDLAPLLRDGGNQLTAEVSNAKNEWAYRWAVEVNGKRHAFACGIPHRSGCKDQGGTGTERGTFPAGSVWLFVDRASGKVEVRE
jgi:hypothetical protein